MVASYLVHHSYCATAEAFAKSTDQAVHEELASIKNRQSESLGVRSQLLKSDTESQVWNKRSYGHHKLQTKLGFTVEMFK